MIAGSQLRDTQGEMLSVEGADISDLEAGRGRFNDNHGKGFFNSIGKVTGAKKIMSLDDCTDPRHEYYWNKVKAPYIYVKGILYDSEDHPNARAAAAIMRNIHKTDSPLKIKASVEGGVTARGLKDESLLARTKIHSVALTFTPANNATLCEPTSLTKGDYNYEADMRLIKSVMHLAKTDIPSFRSVTRNAQAEKIYDNFIQMNEMARELGLKTELKLPNSPEELIKSALEEKIKTNVKKINELAKALTAGYGGAGAPTSLTGGGVMQAEAVDDGRKKKKKDKGFKYMLCKNCGHEQVYMKHQVKCRDCNKHASLEDLYKLMVDG
jgi:hypothetical protein